MKRALGLMSAACAALLAALAGGSPAAAHAACPQLPSALFPKSVANRFTMLIRINQLENVDSYTNHDEAAGGLADRIRLQDIFVINTRFQNPAGTSSPAVAEQIASQLRSAFPCNRIIALNGVSADPTRPGYVYALAHAGLYGVLLDWEPDDWNYARWTNPGMPGWTYRYRPTLRRVGGWMAGLGRALALNSVRTRAGLIPMDHPNWNYGGIAQAIDRHNRHLGRRHLGIQSVQTQGACMSGARGFSRRARALLGSYRYRLVKRKRWRKGRLRRVTVREKLSPRARPQRRNLALQVSFSDTPDPSDPLPVRHVGPVMADRCVAAGLARGAGAFFFFASDNSMRQLFAQPVVGSLRPAG